MLARRSRHRAGTHLGGYHSPLDALTLSCLRDLVSAPMTVSFAGGSVKEVDDIRLSEVARKKLAKAGGAVSREIPSSRATPIFPTCPT